MTRVLIVDDEPQQIAFLREALAAAPDGRFTVVAATENVDEAPRLLAQHAPVDVVVTDLYLDQASRDRAQWRSPSDPTFLWLHWLAKEGHNTLVWSRTEVPEEVIEITRRFEVGFVGKNHCTPADLWAAIDSVAEGDWKQAVDGEWASLAAQVASSRPKLRAELEKGQELARTLALMAQGHDNPQMAAIEGVGTAAIKKRKARIRQLFIDDEYLVAKDRRAAYPEKSSILPHALRERLHILASQASLRQTVRGAPHRLPPDLRERWQKWDQWSLKKRKPT